MTAKIANVFHTVAQKIEKDRVQCLLVGALEGGSNYWYSNADYVLPRGIKYEDFREGGKYTDEDNYFHPLQIIPFVEGCKITVEAEEHENPAGGPWVLDLAKMQRGLELMATSKTYAHHWADFIKENDDAITADVWFQFALFGEVIFG